MTHAPGRRAATAIANGVARLGWLSLALLTGVVAPYVVWRVAGWPLPHRVPTGHQVVTTLTTRYPDTGIYLDVVACLFWYIWLSAALAVPPELAAALRGRPRPHLPLPGPGQALTAALIGGLLLTAGRHRTAVPTATTIPTAATFRTVATAPPGRPTHPLEATLTAPSDPNVTTYQVQPGDTLWGIADTHLGDPMRYRDLAALNQGRLQPDGQTFTDPNDLTPGWTLLIPTTQPRPAGVAGPDAATQPTSPRHTVAPGDTLWTIATRYYPHLDTTDLPGAVRAIYTTNLGTATDTDGHVFDNPSVIYPGMVLDLPAVNPAAAEPRSPSPPPDTVAPSQPDPTPSAPAVPPTINAAPDPSTHPPTPPSPPTRTRAPASITVSPSPHVHKRPDRTPARRHHAHPYPWLAGAGLFATALAGTWISRRRRRDNHVLPGQVLPPADPSVTDLHTALLHADDPDGTDRVDAALRSLAALHHSDDHGPVPQVLLAYPEGLLEVHLADTPPADPPSPWTAPHHPRLWVLPADAPLPAYPDLPPPSPAFVCLGTADDGAALHVDLEALGVVLIDIAGAPGAVKDFAGIARAILAAIIASPWAEITLLRTVGVHTSGLEREERLVVEDSLGSLLAHTTADAQRHAAALDRAGLARTFTARVRTTDESWDPTIALVGELPDDRHDPSLRLLADIAGDGGRGIAAIVPANRDLPATRHWRLRAEDNPEGITWRLDPLGIDFFPLALSENDLDDISALLADAEAPPVDLPDGPADSDAEPFTEPAWTVMVRLLGPVDTVTRDRVDVPSQDVRERPLELLAWLATHRGHRPGELESALWPDGVAAKTLMNTLSLARRHLTDLVGPDAKDWIPPNHGDTLTVHPLVVTDLELVQARIRHAEAQREHPDIAIPTLEGALDLVRGIPAGYPWLDAELGSVLTTAPVTAAVMLARHHLRLGDADAVLDVTRKGLSVLPAHTELFALRLRAYAFIGDSDAITAEYRAYLRAERADPFWDGDTDRDLERLHRQLLRDVTNRAPTTRPPV